MVGPPTLRQRPTSPMSSPSRIIPRTVRPAPPEVWKPLLRVARLATRPLEKFFRIQAASGILLIVAAALALGWANSPLAASYDHFWHARVGFHFGKFVFDRTVRWCVNDGLMTIFFFVVGMEIRRELHHGELSEWRRAALPTLAAGGGMIAPAAIYLLIAGRGEARAGWGIPMATDIAFAVGVLTILGSRVPSALRVLLLALAVIDDLGAIAVIALFYSPGIAVDGLGVAAAGVVALFAFRAVGLRKPWVYVLPGAVVWAGTYRAGIHPTIAGVVVGFCTPVRAWLGTETFVNETRDELNRAADNGTHFRGATPEMNETLRRVALLRREAVAPAELLIESLHPWVAFLIMPLFALANAGVRLRTASLEGAAIVPAMGVVAGLVLGKPIGILVASVVALQIRAAALPRGLRLRHVLVLGIAAGIGFTMSLFVAQLAFDDDRLLATVKLGIVVASLVAMVLALVVGRVLLTPGNSSRVECADETEASMDS